MPVEFMELERGFCERCGMLVDGDGNCNREGCLSTARPGEQPAPVPNSGESMHEAVIAELQRRKGVGLINYNTILQTWNGRDAEQDTIEEAADLMVYMMQSRLERADLKARIRELEALTLSQGNRIAEQSELLGKKAEADGWKLVAQAIPFIKSAYVEDGIFDTIACEAASQWIENAERGR